VLGEDDVVSERLHVAQRVPQEPGRRDRAAVVGEHPNPRLDHLAHLRELFPLEALSVMAPTGWTSQRPAAPARSRTAWITAALSATGWVLAIAATAV
jgi:hypothetical protein